MKKILLICTLLCMMVQTAWAADLSKLIILHTNDTHGYDQRAKGINGMATVAALKKDLEAEGKSVLLVDAGDAIQDNNLVNFSQGKSAIAFMNACGYDVMTLGNHEFDYGQDVTLKRVAEAKFPIVAANILVQATGKTFVPSHTIITKNNIKIGVFGLSTPETKVSTNPKNVLGLNFLAGQELYTCAQQQADYLRSHGCDVVVALTHLGSSPANLGFRSDDIAAHTKGIDIIIDGHDHQEKNIYVGSTLIAETGYYTHNIGKISWNGQSWHSELLPYAEGRREEPKVKKLIACAADQVQKKLSRKIGRSDVLLDGTRAPGVRTKETNLGDFIADAFLWQATQAQVFSTKVDAAIINGGSLRYSLPKGVITKGTIQQILPYNNQLYVMKLKGSTILEVLASTTCISPSALGAFPQVSGIKFVIHSSVPYTKGKQYYNSEYFAPLHPEERITITEIAGAPYDAHKYYYVAMTDFQCNGGDAYGALQPLAAEAAQSIGYIDVLAVENYLKSVLGGNIGANYAEPAGRIIYQ